MKTIFRKNISELNAQQKMACDNKIIWITVGSNLYGTATPESDEDFMGIFMPNEEYVVGLKRVNEVDLSIKSKKAALRITRKHSGQLTDHAKRKAYYEKEQVQLLNLRKKTLDDVENAYGNTKWQSNYLDRFVNVILYDKEELKILLSK